MLGALVGGPRWVRHGDANLKPEAARAAGRLER